MEASMMVPKRSLRLLIAFTLLATISGCPTDPKRTVTLVLDGPQELNARIVEHILPSMVDSGDFSMSWRSDDVPTRVSLYPVRDIEGFSQKLFFGKIEKIEGRQMYVAVDKSRAELVIAMILIKKFIEELPELARWKLRELRVFLLSCYSGEDYDKLLVEDFFRDGQTQAAAGR
jgi:hypothetical protein